MKLFPKHTRDQIVGSVFFVGSTLLASQSYSACTDAPVDGAIYKLINVGSKLLLNVENASTSAGANINTISNNEDSSQRFKLHLQPSQYWTVEASHTNMPINVEKASTSNGGNVIQSKSDSRDSQEWELKQQPDGTYRIVNKNSSYSLTVESGDEYANVYQNQDAAVSSQRWWLEPVSVSCSNSSDAFTFSGSAGDGSAALSWEGLPEITGLQVYQNTKSDTDGRIRIAKLGNTVTSYTATDLKNSTQYWFWLKYRTADSVWHNSDAISVKPMDPAIDIKLSTKAGDGKVELSWKSLGGLTGLQVYQDTDSDLAGRKRIVKLDAAKTSYTVSGLDNNTTYWFSLKYRTSDSVWHNSNAVSAKPVAKTSSSSKVIGFASLDGGTTGGAGGKTVTASNCSSLKSYLESSDRLTVQIPADKMIDCRTSGSSVKVCKISCGSQDKGKYTYRIPTADLNCKALDAVGEVTKTRNDRQINIKSNKTLIGLGAGSGVQGAALTISNQSNVIIKNIKVTNINPHLVEASDGVGISKSDHVVVDHVEFSKISDGHVDIRDSEAVTISYNHFDGYNTYVCGNQHWYTNLVSQSEVTMHHNFYDYVAGRNPKLTGNKTKAHIFNTYWKKVYYFSIGVGHGAQALVEGNYFNDSARPHWNEGDGKVDGNVSTNVYTGQSDTGKYAVKDDNKNVSVPYTYKLEDANNMSNLEYETGPQ